MPDRQAIPEAPPDFVFATPRLTARRIGAAEVDPTIVVRGDPENEASHRVRLEVGMACGELRHNGYRPFTQPFRCRPCARATPDAVAAQPRGRAARAPRATR